MWEWKAENQELTNNNHLIKERSIYGGTNNITYYDIEDELSTMEKMAIIDKFLEGKFFYFTSLNNKYMKAKEEGLLKLDSWGYVKENSKKAWVRRNDDKHIFWNGATKDNLWTKDYLSTFGYHNELYFGYEVTEDKINDTFHYLCRDLANKERGWFCEHDEYEILKTKWREYGCPCFGVHISSCSDGTISVCDGLKHDKWDEGRRDITIDELKALIGAYERLKAYEAELGKEIDIKF